MPPGPNDSRSQSRELWEKAGSSYAALLRAILYELQPFRFRQLNLHRRVHQARDSFKSGVELILRICKFASHWARNDFSLWHAKIIVVVLLYYGSVRAIHAYLEAGPIVLIVTALILIFTVGLADNDNRNPGEMSAYHVFNRGMQRMMGSLDADEVLAQHVGGIFHNGGHPDEGSEHDDQQEAGHPREQRERDADNNVDVGPRNRVARRSRKKARGEQRRQLQQQRELDHDPAVQRLIEEQIQLLREHDM